MRQLFFSFIHAGQIFNGIAGCVLSAAPPFLSNMWFPPHERITATGIATLLTYMGKTAGFKLYLCVLIYLANECQLQRY